MRLISVFAYPEHTYCLIEIMKSEEPSPTPSDATPDPFAPVFPLRRRRKVSKVIETFLFFLFVFFRLKETNSCGSLQVVSSPRSAWARKQESVRVVWGR